jgi:hypothetical protein
VAATTAEHEALHLIGVWVLGGDPYGAWSTEHGGETLAWLSEDRVDHQVFYLLPLTASKEHLAGSDWDKEQAARLGETDTAIEICLKIVELPGFQDAKRALAVHWLSHGGRIDQLDAIAILSKHMPRPWDNGGRLI